MRGFVIAAAVVISAVAFTGSSYGSCCTKRVVEVTKTRGCHATKVKCRKVKCCKPAACICGAACKCSPTCDCNK